MLNITHTLKRFLFPVSFVVLFSISCFSAPVVSKPRVFKVKAVYEKKVFIKWKKVADADGYIISCKNKTTQIIREKKLKGNPKSEYISYTLKGLDYCTKYEICIDYRGFTRHRSRHSPQAGPRGFCCHHQLPLERRGGTTDTTRDRRGRRHSRTASI